MLKKPTLEEHYASYLFNKTTDKLNKYQIEKARYELAKIILPIYLDPTKTQDEKTIAIVTKLLDFYNTRPKAPKSYITFVRFLKRLPEEHYFKVYKEGLINTKKAYLFMWNNYFKIPPEIKSKLKKIIKIERQLPKKTAKKKKKTKKGTFKELVVSAILNKDIKTLKPEEINQAWNYYLSVIITCWYSHTTKKERIECINKKLARIFSKHPELKRSYTWYYNIVKKIKGEDLLYFVPSHILRAYFKKMKNYLSEKEKRRIKKAIS